MKELKLKAEVLNHLVNKTLYLNIPFMVASTKEWRELSDECDVYFFSQRDLNLFIYTILNSEFISRQTIIFDPDFTEFCASNITFRLYNQTFTTKDKFLNSLDAGIKRKVVCSQNSEIQAFNEQNAKLYPHNFTPSSLEQMLDYYALEFEDKHEYVDLDLVRLKAEFETYIRVFIQHNLLGDYYSLYKYNVPDDVQKSVLNHIYFLAKNTGNLQKMPPKFFYALKEQGL